MADPWPVCMFICVGFRVWFGGITQVSKRSRNAIGNLENNSLLGTPAFKHISLSMTMIYVMITHCLNQFIYRQLNNFFSTPGTSIILAFNFLNAYKYL